VESNTLLQWQKLHLTVIKLYQQIRLKFEEETSEMVHRLLWCCSCDGCF